MQPFHTILKNATQHYHSALEALPFSQAIMNPHLKSRFYIHYLSVMYRINEGVEKSIFPMLAGVVNDIEKRHKLNCFHSDFKALQLDETELKPYPLFNIDTNNMSIPFALGILYVMEGSTLGGVVIQKNVNKALQSADSSITKYLYCYGEMTGLYWKNFLVILEQQAKDAVAQEQIIAGANFAFEQVAQYIKMNSEKVYEH